ncbi:MAG: metallophosphoesterase, partial [Oscillospiraceae bacterium]|nr:metallophosphoesterase [Oscillospiraceae bacterium]
MVFVTADTHGELERLTDKKLKFIKKYDTVIVLGDFGFVWDGSREQEKNLKKIAKLPFRVLFIDGYNENFSALEKYPDTIFHNAQAKEICPGQVYYIKRGQVLEIEDMKILCFGGADDY